MKVEGRGSFLNSGSLKEFIQEMIERGNRDIVVDLEQCVMLDSTFMGTLAGIALRLKEAENGRLRVVHCGERSYELLCGLGLDQLFSIKANGATAPQCELLARQEKAASAAAQKREQKQEMLAAHEALCEAAPENEFRFKDVLDYLKQDVPHETVAR